MISALLAVTAWAGACCVGSTTTVPTRVGVCEKALVAVDVRGETSAGRWDADGALRGSSLGEHSAIATLAGAYRWDRRGQVALTVPVWLNHKTAAGSHAWGGGPGDLRLGVTWDAVPEGRRPAPLLSLGVRLPTGRSWREARGPLLEDVTGLVGPALTAGFSVERTTGDVPWSVGVGAEVGRDAAVAASGSIGRYLGRQWSVMGSLAHTETFSDASSARTTLGARVVTGRRLAWRAWVGAEADLPIPYAGRSSMRRLAASTGVAWVR